MSKFVDYSKRDVTLPLGCKDLIDVLLPRRVPRPGIPSEQPAVTRGFQTMDRLSEIPRYVAMLATSKSEHFTLMISAVDDRLSVLLNRTESEEISVFIFAAGDVERERGILEFSQRHGLRVIRDPHSAADGERVLGLKNPLPSTPSQLSKIITELLCSVYALTEESVIQFLNYDIAAVG